MLTPTSVTYIHFFYEMCERSNKGGPLVQRKVKPRKIMEIYIP